MLADFLMATSGVWHQLLYCCKLTLRSTKADRLLTATKTVSPLNLTFIHAYLRKPSKGFLRGFTIAGVLDLG